MAALQNSVRSVLCYDGLYYCMLMTSVGDNQPTSHAVVVCNGGSAVKALDFWSGVQAPALQSWHYWALEKGPSLLQGCYIISNPSFLRSWAI